MIKIGSQASYLFDLVHDITRPHHNLLAGACYAIETFALAAEELQSEFFLEHFELLADTRLRCIQTIGSCRNVQAIIDYRKQIL